ncbi:MAG: SBF-like CPA transporter family-domain-containing protein [Podila humilis]|nr:MAG: SBF-like CPA transporter family-domain-containing protein [Podila humilis]
MEDETGLLYRNTTTSERTNIPSNPGSQPLIPPRSHHDPSSQPSTRSWRTQAWDIWMKNWFLLGLVIAIILARYYPDWGRTGGPLRPEYTAKYGITSCIFLLSGLSLKTSDLLTSAMNYKAHLLVQVTSFVLIPVVVKAITVAMSAGGGGKMNRALLAGMAITSATPTTISSNVVMTANSLGNESLALFNAAMGNLLGVFISPLIVLLLLQGTPESPEGKHGMNYSKILRDLGTTILFPILFGQIYLYYFPRSVQWMKSKVHFPTLNSACLLILVWTVFCDAFHNHVFDEVRPLEIIVIGIIEGAVFWGATFFLDLHLPRSGIQSWCEPMSKPDTVAILFCGATKSVAMGIPMIKILYSSGPESSLAGLLATPLLIYHVEQLFFGAGMVSWLNKWVSRGDETLASFGPAPHTHGEALLNGNGVDDGSKNKWSSTDRINYGATSASVASSTTNGH